VFRIAAKQIIFSGEVIIDNELLVIPVCSLDILDVDVSWRDTLVGAPVVVLMDLLEQLDWCLWAEDISYLLVKQLLDLSQLLLSQLLLRTLSALLSQLKQSLLLPEVVACILREVLSYYELYIVLDVQVAQHQLVNIEADQLAYFRCAQTAPFNDH
jgi:hypothetical protein